MGYYLNPKMGKEAWLAEHGRQIPEDEVKWDPNKETVFIVLIDNTLFLAAGVAYCPAELEELVALDDGRTKTWFAVEANKILDHSFGANVDPGFDKAWNKQ